MTDVWDEFNTGGDFVKFTVVGDKVIGTITNIGRKVWDDGSVSPQLDLDTDDGPKTLTAGQVRLKVALAEKRPKVGDRISVELVDIIKRPGGKTLKEFSVAVGAPAAAAKAASDDTPPW